MAEAELTIGAEASCSDGYCGKVSRLVIDPAARTVTHLVIGPKHRRKLGRLVPIRLVDTTTDHIRLRCTLAEFENLDPAEEVDREVGAEYDLPGSTYDLLGSAQRYDAAGAPIRAYGAGMRQRGVTPIVVNDVVPLGDTEVRHGEHVHALDGEIGQVEGFLVDPSDHRVTHVLLQEGHLWGRKEVTIPISAVTGVDDGIRLSMTKKQVEDLPPAN
jgi:sporulation protein YlmC with PRC-barrel domain